MLPIISLGEEQLGIIRLSKDILESLDYPMNHSPVLLYSLARGKLEDSSADPMPLYMEVFLGPEEALLQSF